MNGLVSFCALKDSNLTTFGLLTRFDADLLTAFLTGFFVVAMLFTLLGIINNNSMDYFTSKHKH